MNKWMNECVNEYMDIRISYTAKSVNGAGVNGKRAKEQTVIIAIIIEYLLNSK